MIRPAGETPSIKPTTTPVSQGLKRAAGLKVDFSSKMMPTPPTKRIHAQVRSKDEGISSATGVLGTNAMRNTVARANFVAKSTPIARPRQEPVAAKFEKAPPKKARELVERLKSRVAPQPLERLGHAFATKAK